MSQEKFGFGDYLRSLEADFDGWPEWLLMAARDLGFENRFMSAKDWHLQQLTQLSAEFVGKYHRLFPDTQVNHIDVRSLEKPFAIEVFERERFPVSLNMNNEIDRAETQGEQIRDGDTFFTTEDVEEINLI